jgi:hypothetical protein
LKPFRSSQVSSIEAITDAAQMRGAMFSFATAGPERGPIVLDLPSLGRRLRLGLEQSADFRKPRLADHALHPDNFEQPSELGCHGGGAIGVFGQHAGNCRYGTLLIE